MDPIDAIDAGRKILDSVMRPAGFHFAAGPHGHSSGGHFAQASYINGDRRLEFSYRFTLGLVTYYVGDVSISHNEFMRFLGKEKDSAYAWFPRESPLAGFEALRHDLQLYCQDFLTNSGDTILKAASAST